MAITKLNSQAIPADAVQSSDLDYPLTGFSSTGIDDNATSTAITIDSSENVDIAGSLDLIGGRLDLSDDEDPNLPASIQNTGTLGNQTSFASALSSSGQIQYSAADHLIADSSVVSSGYPNAWLRVNNGLTFGLGSSTALTINSSEKVGIGTDDPSEALTIAKSGTSARISLTDMDSARASMTGLLEFDGTDSRAGFIGYDAGDMSLYAAVGDIKLSTSGAARLTIDETTGNVGIGEENPAGKLHITSTGNASTITPSTLADELVIENTLACGMSFLSPNFSTQSIFFGDSDDVDAGGIQYDHNVPAMYFREEGSTAMTIKGGDVGIGIAPIYKLDVSDSAASTIVGRFTNTGLAETRVHFDNNAATGAYVGSRGQRLTLSGSGTEDAVIDGSGNVAIGITAAGAPLDIYKPTSANNRMIRLRNTLYDSTDATGFTHLGFGWANHEAASITAFKEQINRTGFQIIGEAGFNVPVTIATFRSTGDVGIGTTSSGGGNSYLSSNNTMLKIKGASANKAGSLQLQSFGTTNNSVFEVAALDASQGSVLGTMTNGPLSLQTNNVTRVTIDASGNLLQTGNVAHRFAGTAGSSIETNINSDGNHDLSGSFSAGAFKFNVGSGQFRWENSSAKSAGSTPSWSRQMTLDSSGNLGIGAPAVSGVSAPLDVDKATPYNNCVANFGEFVPLSGYQRGVVNINGRVNGSDYPASLSMVVRNSGNNNWLHGRIVYNNLNEFIIEKNGVASTGGVEQFKIDGGGRQTITHNQYAYGQTNYFTKSSTGAGNVYLGNVNGSLVLSSNGYYYGGSLRQVDAGKTVYGEIIVNNNGDVSFAGVTGATGGAPNNAKVTLRVNPNGVQHNYGTSTGSFQRFAGKITPTVSGSWIDIAKLNYSHTIKVQGILYSTVSPASGGAMRQVEINTTYGNSATTTTSSHSNGAAFTNLEFRYLNSGGSQSYILQARPTYTGSNPTIDFTVDGWSTADMYPL